MLRHFLISKKKKKAYDSVPIYNIFTKLYNIGICENCFQFLKNLYLTSKVRASHNGCLSEEFPINRGVITNFI